jgi:threonine synthase
MRDEIVRYVSTRGAQPPRDFLDVLLAGTAADGGLFLPEQWPQFSKAEIARFADLPYREIALAILSRFANGSFAPAELRADIDAAYAGFDAAEIVPLVEIGPDRYLLELFHGPTLAFKDLALQVLGRLFARALAKTSERATVIVATSGDTGSAAIAALGGLSNVELFVLHPHGRVSQVQRRQMTTAAHANVHNIAVEGSFDDAQAIVKELFADSNFAGNARLTAVNSINFVRIAAQTVYYFAAAARLGVPPVFVVPTGNFGDVFAGEAATRMGLAVDKLVVATNANDIIVRALNDGVYASGAARATLSPSMDIQVASNFERALFEASGRNAGWMRDSMTDFQLNHRLKIPPKVLAALQVRYAANCANDRETVDVIRQFHERFGRIVDPHTAVALAAARKTGGREGVPVVVLATADPAKFPDAVEAAIGRKPTLPKRLSNIFDLPEKVAVLEAKMPLVRAYIEDRLAHHEP